MKKYNVPTLKEIKVELDDIMGVSVDAIATEWGVEKGIWDIF